MNEIQITFIHGKMQNQMAKDLFIWFLKYLPFIVWFCSLAVNWLRISILIISHLNPKQLKMYITFDRFVKKYQICMVFLVSEWLSGMRCELHSCKERLQYASHTVQVGSNDS